MNDRIYRVLITKCQYDRGYIADVPTVEDCVSYGDTIEEAMKNIRETLEGMVMVMEEEGLLIPDDKNSMEYLISVPSTLAIA